MSEETFDDKNLKNSQTQKDESPKHKDEKNKEDTPKDPTDALGKMAGKFGGEQGQKLAEIAAGAAAIAAGNLLQGTKMLAKYWVEITLALCLAATALILQVIIVMVIIIAPIAATYEAPGAAGAWIWDNTIGQDTNKEGGRGGDSLCPILTIPDWSKNATKESGIILTKDASGNPVLKNLDEEKQGGCYGKVLKKEAQKTGVPWEFLAAIDFRYIENAGIQDCYDCFMEDFNGMGDADDRLKKIGNDLQVANAERKGNGELIMGTDGNLRHSIEPNRKYLVGEAETFIKNYHCLYIKGSSEEWCFAGRYKKERYDFYTVDHWLWDGFDWGDVNKEGIDKESYKDRLGVMAWYKNKTKEEGYNKECSFDELFRDPDAQPSPGARLSKVPVFKQCDPKWGTKPYDTGNICSHGCGPSALAMVLTYYGHTTDPAKVATEAKTVGGEAGGKGSNWSMFNNVASKYYNMGASQINLDETLQRLERGEPIIASTSLYGGHFIVLAEKTGDTIPISGSAKADPDAITLAELQRIGKAYFYVHP